MKTVFDNEYEVRNLLPKNCFLKRMCKSNYFKNASVVATFLHVLCCIVFEIHFLLTGRCLSIAAVRARVVYFLPPDCAHCCGTS